MSDTNKAPKPPTYRTGFCANGQCEGLKPRNFRGRALPTCTFTSAECACSCHKIYDEIFEIAGMDRVVQDISGYVPDHGRFILPDRYSLMVERAERRTGGKPTDDASAVAVGGHVFAPTPTGMRAPGQLEYTVLEILNSWIDPTFELVPPTPKLVAFMVGKKRKEPEPSTGAINSIFCRWVEIGFAKFQHRPAQFLGFVEEGTEGELDILKKNNKRPPANKRYLRNDHP